MDESRHSDQVWKPSEEGSLEGLPSEGGLSDIYKDLPIFGSIPAELHSAYTDALFTHCTVCEKALTSEALYEIQKVFRGKECVFELAICHTCLQGIVGEYSEESKQAISNFHLKNLDLDNDGCCEFCSVPRRKFASYTLVGACRHDSLILPVVLVCETCEEAINELLSKKTKDIHGEFIRDHFPGVPVDLEFSPSFGGII